MIKNKTLRKPHVETRTGLRNKKNSRTLRFLTGGWEKSRERLPFFSIGPVLVHQSAVYPKIANDIVLLQGRSLLI
jgi:hypothetical protein